MTSVAHKTYRLPKRVAFLCAECATPAPALPARLSPLPILPDLRSKSSSIPTRKFKLSPETWQRASSTADFRSVAPLLFHLPPTPGPSRPARQYGTRRRSFHTYFVTHLPSSSMHPDARRIAGGHKLPRDASTPHTPSPGASPAVAIPNLPSRDLTVVRIPLRRAKHHFGSATSRGSRPYNEDTDQAGIVNIPAFAKRGPMSVKQKPGEPTPAESQSGDPQVFYFGIFDGHGGSQCSDFLRDELHGYIEEAASTFGLQSSLRRREQAAAGRQGEPQLSREGALGSISLKTPEEVEEKLAEQPQDAASSMRKAPRHGKPLQSESAVPAKLQDYRKAVQLERDLVSEYADTIGGYFRRFNPEHFDLSDDASYNSVVSFESALTYAFLRADLDFVSAQARKAERDSSDSNSKEGSSKEGSSNLCAADSPVNTDDASGVPRATPSRHDIGGPVRFKGGSTASVALISTPTPAPFWHPAAQSTLLTAHVGDTRILLCDTATGLPRPLTSDHHPSTPVESRRLRRYISSSSSTSSSTSSSSPPLFTGLDSFGEERFAGGLANSRAFGDVHSKRVGVSAEPEVSRVELAPAQYSFLVLVTDGVSGSLSDQEIVDVVKEARTPEQGARDVVDYATEVSADGDNATCQVVRLGGWERRSEGGLGPFGTREIRDVRRAEALDPRRGKQ